MKDRNAQTHTTRGVPDVNLDSSGTATHLAVRSVNLVLIADWTKSKVKLSLFETKNGNLDVSARGSVSRRSNCT